MFGFELVKDQESKQPFEVRQRASMVFEEAAFRRGLVTYPCTGAIDGTSGDMMLLAPPLVISETQVNEILNIIDDTLDEFENRL
jgi:adenosylmethionine-8-amino-7-oxononanoate aminotransferase